MGHFPQSWASVQQDSLKIWSQLKMGKKCLRFIMILTRCCLVTDMCVMNMVSIGPGNVLSSGRHKPLPQPKLTYCQEDLWEQKFYDAWTIIIKLSFKEMHLCPGLLIELLIEPRNALQSVRHCSYSHPEITKNNSKFLHNCNENIKWYNQHIVYFVISGLIPVIFLSVRSIAGSNVGKVNIASWLGSWQEEISAIIFVIIIVINTTWEHVGIKYVSLK